jgi:hypothetical protein
MEIMENREEGCVNPAFEPTDTSERSSDADPKDRFATIYKYVLW